MDRAQFYAVRPFNKSVDENLFCTATTVYLRVWNMDCSYCGVWLRNTLLELDAVLRVDAFVDCGIVAVTYCSDRSTVTAILATIQALGTQTQRYYGAEIVGEEPATVALRSRHSA